MKCFKYKIYKDSELVLINWINSETKEDALNSLSEEYEGAVIKLIEV